VHHHRYRATKFNPGERKEIGIATAEKSCHERAPTPVAATIHLRHTTRDRSGFLFTQSNIDSSEAIKPPGLP